MVDLHLRVVDETDAEVAGIQSAVGDPNVFLAPHHEDTIGSTADLVPVQVERNVVGVDEDPPVPGAREIASNDVLARRADRVETVRDLGYRRVRRSRTTKEANSGGHESHQSTSQRVHSVFLPFSALTVTEKPVQADYRRAGGRS